MEPPSRARHTLQVEAPVQQEAEPEAEDQEFAALQERLNAVRM